MSTYATPAPAGSGWHPTHVTHLVFGMLFLGLVGAWAAYAAGLVDSGDVRWLIPLPWVVAGGAGLVAATMSNRRGGAVSIPEHAGVGETADLAAPSDPFDPTDLNEETR